jgi:6,7-dimethyl-8-ribityllumazine synthase
MSTQSNELYNTSGIQLPTDAFVVLVCTEWNAEVINELKNGAVQVLATHNVNYSILMVPGAVEIPFAINNHFNKAATKPNAYIALGCVLRGDTPHFDYVCQSVTQGITHLNVTLPVPTIFGVLTVNTQTQIEERLGGKHGHKGEEAAITALKMMALA